MSMNGGELGPVLDCVVLDTGHCLASEHHLMRGGRRARVDCHAIAALLRHPEHGWTLWDAGYAPRLLDVTRRLPFRLYRHATPLRLRPELAVVAQLPRLGLAAADIKRVVISHFHADHIAGLRDFPDAEWIATRTAFEGVGDRRGWRALARAFVPALLPDGFAARATLLPAFDGPPLANLGPTFDLFGDGSALLVELPGHARGQIGLLARTDRGRIFFAADGCWLRESYRLRRPPHPVTYLFVDDSRAVATTIDRLHEFARDHPDVAIVPSHCPEALREFVGPTP